LRKKKPRSGRSRVERRGRQNLASPPLLPSPPSRRAAAWAGRRDPALPMGMVKGSRQYGLVGVNRPAHKI
jgi:hypothetical protein